MFNTYHAGDTSQNISINAVTGAILKNHPHSWFEKFHLESNRAEHLLKEGGDTGYKRKGRNGYVYDECCPENAIIVLQMVICGDMEVIAECVYARDYEPCSYGERRNDD